MLGLLLKLSLYIYVYVDGYIYFLLKMKILLVDQRGENAYKNIHFLRFFDPLRSHAYIAAVRKKRNAYCVFKILFYATTLTQRFTH